MPKTQEKILSQIKLKYFSSPKEDHKKLTHADMECVWCGQKNIVFGGAIDAHTNNPKFFCENCAIEHWQKDYGFKTREAAAAHRRRMFDIGYLFQEMWIDKYLKVKKIKDVDELKTSMMDILMRHAQDIYNEKISKKKKQDLECYFYQEDIEEYLKKMVNKYFNL